MDGIDSNDLRLSLWSGKLELKDVKDCAGMLAIAGECKAVHGNTARQVKEDVLGLLGVEGGRHVAYGKPFFCKTLFNGRDIA